MQLLVHRVLVGSAGRALVPSPAAQPHLESDESMFAGTKHPCTPPRRAGRGGVLLLRRAVVVVDAVLVRAMVEDMMKGTSSRKGSARRHLWRHSIIASVVPGLRVTTSWRARSSWRVSISCWRVSRRLERSSAGSVGKEYYPSGRTSREPMRRRSPVGRASGRGRGHRAVKHDIATPEP